MSIRGIVLGIATAALLAGPACAQTKIGLIDLTKVFEGYYKTKAAKGLLRDQEDRLQAVLYCMAELRRQLQVGFFHTQILIYLW